MSKSWEPVMQLQKLRPYVNLPPDYILYPRCALCSPVFSITFLLILLRGSDWHSRGYHRSSNNLVKKIVSTFILIQGRKTLRRFLVTEIMQNPICSNHQPWRRSNISLVKSQICCDSFLLIFSFCFYSTSDGTWFCRFCRVAGNSGNEKSSRGANIRALRLFTKKSDSFAVFRMQYNF